MKALLLLILIITTGCSSEGLLCESCGTNNIPDIITPTPTTTPTPAPFGTLFFWNRDPVNGYELHFISEEDDQPYLFFDSNPGYNIWAGSTGLTLSAYSFIVDEHRFVFTENVDISGSATGPRFFLYDSRDDSLILLNNPASTSFAPPGADPYIRGAQNNVAVAELNGKYYFAGTTSANGTELFYFDSEVSFNFINLAIDTTTSTDTVSSGATNSGPIYSFDDRVWFACRTANPGLRTLCIYDPNTNTFVMKSTQIGSREIFYEFNGTLFISSFYVSGGTIEYYDKDTDSLINVPHNPPNGGGAHAGARMWTNSDTDLYIYSETDSSSLVGTEIYTITRTSSTRTALEEFIPGDANWSGTLFEYYDGHIYFIANRQDGIGESLWRLNLTTRLHELVYDYKPGVNNTAFLKESFLYNGKVYIVAADGAVSDLIEVDLSNLSSRTVITGEAISGVFFGPMFYPE